MSKGASPILPSSDPAPALFPFSFGPIAQSRKSNKLSLPGFLSSFAHRSGVITPLILWIVSFIVERNLRQARCAPRRNSGNGVADHYIVMPRSILSLRFPRLPGSSLRR